MSGLIQAHKKSSNVPKTASNHRWPGAKRPLNSNRVYKRSSQVLHGNRVYKPMAAKAAEKEKTKQLTQSLIETGATVKPNPIKLSSTNSSSNASSSTVVATKRGHSNCVFKPVNASSQPSTSIAQTTSETRLKATKSDKTTGSKFKWKRLSVSDDKKPSMS